MHSKNWVFYICANNLFILMRLLILRNNNALINKIVVNDYIPQTHRSKRIREVDLRIIRNSKYLFDQFQLVIKATNKINVLDIVLNEKLIILLIQIEQRFIFRIIKFAFAKFNVGDVIQTIGFLISECELPVEL